MSRLPSLPLKTLAASLALLTAATPSDIYAGPYIFANEQRLDLVLHPSGYNGTGGNLNVNVCINPTSPNAADMVIPVQNAIDRMNALVPTVGNVRTGSDSELAGNQVDFESVFIHELGHCVGLAHVNLASESGLSSPQNNFTKTTDGSNNTFDRDDGPDNVIGSADDARGDDDNLHWFFVNRNNPFELPVTPESGTYSRDLADLPSGDNFATNADRTVSTSLFGLPATEAIMQQLTFGGEDQRSMAADGVATLLHAQAGLDRIAGTNDDYNLVLNYGGLATGCDINIAFDDSETGFAVCQVSGGSITTNNWRIGQANTFYNTGSNWFFSDERIPTLAQDNITVAFGGSTSELNGGGTSLLANDDSGLLMSSAVFFGGDAASSITLNSNGTFNYTHDGASGGNDRFVYRACTNDGGSESNTCNHQWVNVTVLTSGNNPPTAVDDAASVTRGGTVTQLNSGQISLLANDSDPDSSDSLTAVTTPVSGPSSGTVDIETDGTFSYTHDGSLTPSDSFVYRVCDDGLPSTCSTATVNITVDLGSVICTSPGVAIPDNSPGGVSSMVSVPPGDNVSDLDVSLAISHTYIGDLVVTLTHVDSGTQVSLIDRPGLPGSNFGCNRPNISVTLDDEANSAAEDQCSTTSPALGGTHAPNGSLADFDGIALDGDWTLTVADLATNDVGTLNQWCLVPETAVGNAAPVANNDGPGGVFTADEGGEVTFTAAQLAANDTDAEDGTPPGGNVLLASTTSNGTLTGNGNQTFTYVHNGSETSSDSFQYRISDSDGQSSNTATVNITITPQNDMPIAADDGPGGIFSVAQGQTVTLSAGNLTANDSDAEDGAPAGNVLLSGQASNGSVVDNGNQTFTFTHDDSTTTSASFQYQVTDGSGAPSNTATVNLSVTDGSAPPAIASCARGGRRIQTDVPASINTTSLFALAGTLTYSQQGLPPSLSIDPASGVISGTAVAADLAGSPFDVTVTATTDSTTDSARFQLTVDASNDVSFYASFEDSCF